MERRRRRAELDGKHPAPLSPPCLRSGPAAPPPSRYEPRGPWCCCALGSPTGPLGRLPGWEEAMGAGTRRPCQRGFGTRGFSGGA